VEGDILRFGEWIGKVLSPSEAHADPAEHRFDLIAPGLYGGALLRRTLARLGGVSASELPIVIEGETGTGKEWAARAIHGWSRRGQTFLAVNCAALPESLAEAELFGYRKGAFTGADRASAGYFRAAHGGTLLLDEIIELSLAAQAKLLRVLEEREIVPIGETSPVPVDVRVLAAAQQPLREAVAERRFRADLCARLDGLTLRLPSLRDRIEDVPALLRQKLRDHGKTDVDFDWRFVERLCLYDWPFNVREVNQLAQQLALGFPAERVLRADHLPDRIREVRGRSPDQGPLPVSKASAPASEGDGNSRHDRDEHDMLCLLAGLRRHHGNLARAAADARISRQRAYRLMGARPDAGWPERERRSAALVATAGAEKDDG
jgi:transcriptional regulator with PAS, ATPase and Fis domain